MNSAAWRAALIGALVAAFATLPGLGSGTLWDNSETAYGEVAREILLTHDWVVMHLNGAPWYVQPPLYFWISAFFGRVWGVSEWTLRLPSALATIAMAGAVGYVVARVASARAAIWAATILSTALMQAVLGRLAIMDALLDLAVTLAILAWFGALRTGTARHWYGGWLALALGTLAKGPVAIVMTVLVMLPWALWTRRAGGRIVMPSPRRWALGLALFVAVVLPWSAALYRAAGPTAFGEMLLHYTVGRYLGTIENQSGPLWYYVPVAILGFFPWFAFLIPGAAQAWRDARASPLRERGEPGDDGAVARLALVWAVVPFVFFSLAKTKLPNYIALELPAFAILVALWFVRVVDRPRRRAALAWAAIVPLTICGIAFAIWAFSHDNRLTADLQEIRSDFLALGIVMLAGSAASFAALLRRANAWLAPYALAAASLVVLVLIGAVGEPLVERFKPIPPLAAAIERARRPGDAVAIEGVSGGNALVFYTRPRVTTLDNPGDATTTPATDPRNTICGAARAFVIASKKRPASDPTYGRTRTEIARSNNDVLYRYDGPPCDARARPQGEATSRRTPR
ncbi:MAG: glycosyltransferase family 39 protein [Vulcanimicrobiaceae bacterium]